MHSYNDINMCLIITKFCDRHEIDHGEVMVYCPDMVEKGKCKEKDRVYKEEVTRIGCCRSPDMNEKDFSRKKGKKKSSTGSSMHKTTSRSSTGSRSSASSSRSVSSVSSTMSMSSREFEKIPKPYKFFSRAMGLVR